MRFNVKRILAILCCAVLLLCYGCRQKLRDEYVVYDSAITKILNNYQFYKDEFDRRNIKTVREKSEDEEGENILVITGTNEMRFVFFEHGACVVNIKKTKHNNADYETGYELTLRIWHESENDIRIGTYVSLYVDGKFKRSMVCDYENGNFEQPIDDTKDISYGLLPVEEPTYEDREKADKLIKEAFTIEELEAYYAEAMGYFDLILEVSKTPV